MSQFITKSERETADLAEKLCKNIKAGSIVLFFGEMGAGKTAFVRGALKAYNNPSFVSSPTFALVNDYGGSPRIYHFDMYRVTDENDLYSSGFFDYADENSVLFIEWSENIIEFIEDYYSDRIIKIDIQKSVNESERIITVEGGEF
ncbi:MAG: tRNA (adenosine(37)-N6)-threonylcarbamoyltransferase complex ATPase subunit type 1 TsaE [Oscillospiraceae bacterium]|nr:tRNA (adenosine(37)-N6)-threonylcarbamoyltransferase complex ATPase subunit type 1 TsaE [Oscillospiraceae bacterium]